MTKQHREAYFFTERYVGENQRDREKHQSRKNTLNYMNRFTISEADAFEIAGFYEIENTSETFHIYGRTLIPHRHMDISFSDMPRYMRCALSGLDCKRMSLLRHLSKASGIVHIFISGMSLYTDHIQFNAFQSNFNEIKEKQYQKRGEAILKQYKDSLELSTPIERSTIKKKYRISVD